MKKFAIVLFVLTVLVVAVPLFGSCAQEEATKTVTVTSTVTSTKADQGATTTVISSPFTKTLTMQPSGSASVVITSVFEAQPPAIPHPYILDNPSSSQVEGLISETGGAICFECHGVPPQHNLWAYNADVCSECHIISNNPALVPHWPALGTDNDS